MRYAVQAGTCAGMLLSLIVLFARPACGQQSGLLQLNSPVHHFLQKQQTLGRLPDAFLMHQPLSAYEAARYLDTLAAHRSQLDAGDRQILARLRGEAPAPGARWVQRRIPWLYENGNDFLAVQGDDYALQLHPLLYLGLGYARQTETLAQDAAVLTWRNTFGVRAAGRIGPLFFEARMNENLERPLRPQFDDTATTAPRLGQIRFYEDRGVYDYFQATGMVGFRTDHFEVRFGRARNRWSFGPGSVLLSNYAPVYDQLQIRTNVWRIQYVNLFTRFIDGTNPGGGNFIRPRRYGAFHSLAIDLPGRVQLQFFEAIVFATDSTAAQRRSNFELAYLNPVIFYRAVEHDLGSPDNALVGAAASWVPTPGLKVYGQFLLDELRVTEIGSQWWANKWGWMLGAHWAEPLDAQGLTARFEFARLRPYLYSHRTNATAFVHYGDLLGHPAGPNSLDAALFLEYRPSGRFLASLNAAYTVRGRNTESENYGADPTKSYDSRVADRSVEILQGVRQERLLVEGQVGYELHRRVIVGATLRAEVVDDALRGVNRYVWPALMLRWGLPFESTRY